MAIISVEGFIDTHVHTGPAPFRRIGDTIDIARWCREAKMTAIVIKSHFEATITKVYHARKEVPDLELYAGVALNRGVGGINPAAVEQALRQDAKVVWMPTIDAQNHVRVFGAPGAFGAIGAGSYSHYYYPTAYRGNRDSPWHHHHYRRSYFCKRYCQWLPGYRSFRKAQWCSDQYWHEGGNLNWRFGK